MSHFYAKLLTFYVVYANIYVPFVELWLQRSFLTSKHHKMRFYFYERDVKPHLVFLPKGRSRQQEVVGVTPDEEKGMK